MKTALPYIIIVLMAAFATIWILTDSRFKPTKHEDPRDRIIDSLRDRNSQISHDKDSLVSLLTYQQDSFLNRLKTYDSKSLTQKVKIFIERTGQTDTSQPTIIIDSSQVDACNKCYFALDSNRSVVRIQSKIINLSEEIIGNCSTSNRLLTDQITECREDVENWERLYNLRWWQIFKRCKLKRKLK